MHDSVLRPFHVCHICEKGAVFCTVTIATFFDFPVCAPGSSVIFINTVSVLSKQQFQ